MSKISVKSLGEEYNGVVRISSWDWIRAVEENDTIDATGVDTLMLNRNVNTAAIGFNFLESFDKIVKDDGKVSVQVHAWLLPYGRAYSDNKVVELVPLGDLTQYSFGCDPYSLYSKFTAPREGEDVSVWDCKRDISVEELEIEAGAYGFCNAVAVIDNIVTVVANTLYYPTLDDALSRYAINNGEVFKDIKDLIVIHHISGFCSGVVGYAASVWCNDKLYTVKKYTEENFTKIADMIRSGSSVGSDFESIIKSLPMSVVRDCETNEELLALVRRHMG